MSVPEKVRKQQNFSRRRILKAQRLVEAWRQWAESVRRVGIGDSQVTPAEFGAQIAEVVANQLEEVLKEKPPCRSSSRPRELCLPSVPLSTPSQSPSTTMHGSSSGTTEGSGKS